VTQATLLGALAETVGRQDRRRNPRNRSRHRPFCSPIGGRERKEKGVTFLKSALAKGAIVAVLASGALATTASADVACNRYGECWRGC